MCHAGFRVPTEQSASVASVIRRLTTMLTYSPYHQLITVLIDPNSCMEQSTKLSDCSLTDQTWGKYEVYPPCWGCPCISCIAPSEKLPWQVVGCVEYARQWQLQGGVNSEMAVQFIFDRLGAVPTEIKMYHLLRGVASLHELFAHYGSGSVTQRNMSCRTNQI